MSYLLLAGLLLVVPGFCITRLLRLDKMRFLLSISFSYAVFVLLLLAIQKLGYDIVAFTMVYFATITLLMMSCLAKGFLEYRQAYNGRPRRLATVFGIHNWQLLAMGGLLVIVTVYHLYAGPYLELPADIFQHLEYIRHVSRNIAGSELTGRPLPVYNLGLNGNYWHIFYALVADWSDTSITAAIAPASYLNAVIFVLAFFTFSQVVFERSLSDNRLLAMVGFGSSVFCFLHFGVNVFSFLRYYAMAPVMLNLVLFFTIMSIAIGFFERKNLPYKSLVSAAVITIVAAYIHLQEALFAGVLVYLMSLYAFVRQNFLRDRRSKIQWTRTTLARFIGDRVNLVFMASTLAMLMFVAYSFLARGRNPALQPKLMSLGDYLPYANDFYILDPTYQFYYVITLWGVLVYLLFVVNWKQFRGNIYIVAGMASPLFTVFNPVFTDLFLRYSLTEMYWRLTFIVPLHLVAGYLLVYLLKQFMGRALRYRFASVVAVLALLVLLLPLHTRYVEAPYSRLLTLKKSPIDNTPEHWQDLLGYLEGVTKRDSLIITDPVTGYMLSALTRHSSPRKKFHRHLAGYIRFNYDDYAGHPFDRYAGHMLIINRRDGGASETGRVARHWPENILKVSAYYPQALIEYLAANPKRFELKWDAGDIQVYRIHGKPASG